MTSDIFILPRLLGGILYISASPHALGLYQNVAPKHIIRRNGTALSCHNFIPFGAELFHPCFLGELVKSPSLLAQFDFLADSLPTNMLQDYKDSYALQIQPAATAQCCLKSNNAPYKSMCYRLK